MKCVELWDAIINLDPSYTYKKLGKMRKEKLIKILEGLNAIRWKVRRFKK